jgi:hypothetical protein
MKIIFLSLLSICILATYPILAQNKRPEYLGKPAYATFGAGIFFDQALFLRFSYEQRLRKHFGVEAYLAPSIPLGFSSQFRMLHHFGFISNSNYTNFDPYVGGSFGGKFLNEYRGSGQFGVFTGFRLMPNPDYGFYVETGINYIGNARYDNISKLEVQFQVGICRKFLNKKPI